MPLPLSFHPWNRRIVPADRRVTHAPIAGRLLTSGRGGSTQNRKQFDLGRNQTQGPIIQRLVDRFAIPGLPVGV